MIPKIESIRIKAMERLIAEHTSRFDVLYCEELVAATDKRTNQQIAEAIVNLAPEKRISCIKVVRSITGCGLKEAKDLCEVEYNKIIEARNSTMPYGSRF